MDALIAEISGQESQVKAAEAKLQAAANAADAEIRAAEKELASQIANVPSESGFLWPLPGRYNLSSLYGSRKHPVTGKANNHTGIDVPMNALYATSGGVKKKLVTNKPPGSHISPPHHSACCGRGGCVLLGQLVFSPDGRERAERHDLYG